MIRYFVNQSRLLLIIMVIGIIHFTVVLYVGIKWIYDREAGLMHGLAISELNTAVSLSKDFFFDLENYLLFLSNQPVISNYVESRFKSVEAREGTRRALETLVDASKGAFSLSIVDSSGRGLVGTETPESPRQIFEEEHLPDHRHDSFSKVLTQWNNDEGVVLAIDSDIGKKSGKTYHEPIIMAGIPLFDSKGRRSGILILYVYVSKFINRLPPEISIQTEDGNRMFLDESGVIRTENSDLLFEDLDGTIRVSDIETIHYDTLEIAKFKVVMIKRHLHAELKKALSKLVIAAVLTITLFLSLLSGVVHAFVFRMREEIRIQKALTHSMVRITEGRDPETGDHVGRTRNYALTLAKTLKRRKKYAGTITAEFLDNIYEAAPLHDIGKVGVRDDILLKQGRLTADEFEEMKQHVVFGVRVFQDIIHQFGVNQSVILMCRDICAHHHEKYDGTGYPEGLIGNEIPLEARIFALADVYDALRSKRPYKDEMTHEETADYVKSSSGKHFDPDVVDAFIECEEEFVEIANDLPQTEKER